MVPIKLTNKGVQSTTTNPIEISNDKPLEDIVKEVVDYINKEKEFSTPLDLSEYTFTDTFDEDAAKFDTFIGETIANGDVKHLIGRSFYAANDNGVILAMYNRKVGKFIKNAILYYSENSQTLKYFGVIRSLSNVAWDILPDAEDMYERIENYKTQEGL